MFSTFSIHNMRSKGYSSRFLTACIDGVIFKCRALVGAVALTLSFKSCRLDHQFPDSDRHMVGLNHQGCLCYLNTLISTARWASHFDIFVYGDTIVNHTNKSRVFGLFAFGIKPRCPKLDLEFLPCSSAGEK